MGYLSVDFYKGDSHHEATHLQFFFTESPSRLGHDNKGHSVKKNCRSIASLPSKGRKKGVVCGLLMGFSRKTGAAKAQTGFFKTPSGLKILTNGRFIIVVVPHISRIGALCVYASSLSVR